MNYKDYEIPKDLVFETQDILDLHGLECSMLLNPKDFEDVANIKKIELKLKFSVLSKEVMAMGQVSGVVRVECSRCLKSFTAPFDEEFTQLYPTKEKIIDIMYITKQTIALLESIQNLCTVQCKGLCSYCGCNKNEVECDCKPAAFNQFACLKEKFKNK